MRKLILASWVAAAGLLLSAGRLEGQEPGVKLGFLRAHGDISSGIPGITWGPIHEFSAGLYFSVDILGGQLGIRPEVNYTTKGFDARETDPGGEVSSKYKISYIEVPVLITWKMPLKGTVRPAVFFGPYAGFARKVTEVQTAFGETEKRELGDNLKGPDFGFVFGGNVRYGLGAAVLFLDVRYSLGLSNISKDIKDIAYEFLESDKIKNRSLAVALGIGFDLTRREGNEGSARPPRPERGRGKGFAITFQEENP